MSRNPTRRNPPPVSAVTEAASVLLTRGPNSPEVFVVRRAEALRFFGGFHAFPGGKVHADDALCLPGASPLDVRRVAAVRELFEETGVLLARRADGSFPVAGPELEPIRRDFLEDRRCFSEFLASAALAVWPDDLVSVGSLVTPPFTTMRFDTAFFVANLPPGQEPIVWTGELDAGRWISADDLLNCWARGECLVSPPTLSLLGAVRGRPIADLPARISPLLAELDRGAIHPIWFSPGVQMIPLRTIALAPSRHTNAFLVGTGPFYLIDPGPTDADEQQRLFHLLDDAAIGGRRLDAIILTHHHPDHIGAANACAVRYGVPIWSHARTAELLIGRVPVSRFIDDGERLDMGVAPDGVGRWHLQAIHTPGHAPGHLVFHDPRYRVLLAGDMISTLSSIIVAPPDGDLSVYLESLRKLQSYECRLLLPSHGSASSRPARTLAEALEHRARREEQLLALLRSEPCRIAEIVAELYKGLPQELMRMAELQTLAGLLKLQREGRVESAGEPPGWRRPD